ncbi:YdcF family protein [Roseobacteraceae bacterium S113]
MDFDSAFFIFSKIVRPLLVIETWVIVTLLIAAFALWRGRGRLTGICLGLALFLLLGMRIVPVGDLMLRPLEASYPAMPPLERVDGIVVLGGAEDLWRARNQQAGMNAAAERFIESAALARRFPEARLVYSGGSAALRMAFRVNAKRGALPLQAYTTLGLDPDRVEIDLRARNTVENAKRTFEYAQPGPEEVWVVVTSAFHMRRAMRNFEAAGWPNVVAYPVDFRARRLDHARTRELSLNMHLFNIALREWLRDGLHRLSP